MLQLYSRMMVLLALLSPVILSCASVADKLDSSWSPEIFFKNAHEAMDKNRYQDAIFYYEVFLVRYPEDISRRIAAEYEMAFIHYKMGNLKIAETQFATILKNYEDSPYAVLFPPRFKQLSEIGLNNIEKSRSVKNKLFWRMNEKKWAKNHDETLTDSSDTQLE